MPYIKPVDRAILKNLTETIDNTYIDSAGNLNFLITKLVHKYLSQSAESYQRYNDALGALEGAKQELYRRKVAPYEDKKISSNGDV